MNRTNTALLVLMLLAAPAYADWTGVGEAGLVIASGNSDTETGNAKLGVATELNKWKHAAGASALYAKTDDVKTASRWELSGQSDYNFRPKTFSFAAARYENDKFSGFEYQATLSAGIGQKFIDNDRTKFTGTAGAGYKFFRTRDTEDDLGNVVVAGEKDDQLIFRGTAIFEHSLTDTTTLTNDFIVESGSSNTYVENNLALQVKIYSKLALALGFVIRHNTDPPAGFARTDKLTTINLVYEIR